MWFMIKYTRYKYTKQIVLTPVLMEPSLKSQKLSNVLYLVKFYHANTQVLF